MSEDYLKEKLRMLSKTIWEDKISWEDIREWLENFRETPGSVLSERSHALYLLSQFVYFGSREMRELLKALYRDHYRYPAIEKIRRANGDTTDLDVIRSKFDDVLRTTRFIGVGNPSESGTHLLYFFRQENRLPKSLFIHTHEIFARYGTPSALKLRSSSVERYIFIDDLCGSGNQAVSYSQEIVESIKQLNPNVSVGYYVLFATSSGLKEVRENTLFDDIKVVFELDETFKCFSEKSRHFQPGEFDRAFAMAMCEKYGATLVQECPLGYQDGQLLIGFHHNIPDNTLPIIWFDEDARWKPIFRRYPKLYGWPDGN